ncbi:PAS domain-containing sensor histidine kinase [Oceanihabitans sp. 1_MG-2023]|uniref:sensor histidine kinase n=1 Tax=Flavobacteriaceae TaxID=49546 RepID=UPI002090FFF9|nr:MULTISPECIES: PAS domain-containing sensor histidine kinase [Flavobacteriaceae]MDO6623641.1 PAS domain-containing sensor histidine kinase [Oceanihabitans sp. 1_MG-2023]
MSIPDDNIWKLALEYTNIGVWEYDAETKEVFYSNESNKILGFDEDNVLKDNINAWNDRVHEKDRVAYFQDFTELLNGVTPNYQNEHRIRCKDGSYKWILDKGKIVSWLKNGQPKRVIGTHTDITILKNSEQITKDALNLASKQNNQLRNFAHIVTHNLKQHAGNFESLIYLYHEAETNSEKKELINHLETLSNSLTKTINNLNQVVSVQANKNNRVEKIFIAQEVKNVLNSLDFVIAENKVTIHNNINTNLFINYNPSYFESVILNLLTNAIKYKHPERDPVISIDSKVENKTLYLIISDNGLGIDLNKYGDNVFGLYKTFHKNDNSEGVGLYLIKNQIESFGGKIAIESQVNIGTTFTITTTHL